MKKSNVGIYAFTSKVSGFCYVGQSSDLAKRKYEHLRRLNNDSHICKHLQSHYKKHGKDSLEYVVLENCPFEVLTEREQYFMDLFRVSGLFNSAPAAGSVRGIVVSKETRLKIGAASVGRKQSAETIKMRFETRILNGNSSKGIPRSAETIQKMSDGQKGKKQSAETRQKMHATKIKNGSTRLGIPRDIETREKLRVAILGKTMSEEAKQKIRAALSGKKKSPEHVAKVRAALIARHQAIIAGKQLNLLAT